MEQTLEWVELLAGGNNSWMCLHKLHILMLLDETGRIYDKMLETKVDCKLQAYITPAIMKCSDSCIVDEVESILSDLFLYRFGIRETAGSASFLLRLGLDPVELYSKFKSVVFFYLRDIEVRFSKVDKVPSLNKEIVDLVLKNTRVDVSTLAKYDMIKTIREEANHVDKDTLSYAYMCAKSLMKNSDPIASDEITEVLIPTTLVPKYSYTSEELEYIKAYTEEAVAAGLLPRDHPSVAVVRRDYLKSRLPGYNLIVRYKRCTINH